MDEQKRLLLALVLMAVVVVLMTSFWPSDVPDNRPSESITSGDTKAGQTEEA